MNVIADFVSWLERLFAPKEDDFKARLISDLGIER
jgi:hypothetical protein